MKRIVASTLIITSLYMSSICCGHAFDIDETVDDEIRKNYNPNQLVKDVKGEESALDIKLEATPSTKNNSIDANLPALPSISKSGSVQVSTPDIEIPSKVYLDGKTKIKSGTSFNVINTTSISDWQRKGTIVKFKTKGNTYGKGFTIPNDTVFIGEILDSHLPQITCNGGLVVIKIDYMLYKGHKIPVTGYVTRANDKRIFFNNIKGERTYLKTTWKKGNWGRTLFNQMLGVSAGLGSEGATLILTPFPFTYGTICLGVSAITSPICAFFSKGGHISIPANSNFRIKLIEDAMID